MCIPAAECGTSADYNGTKYKVDCFDNGSSTGLIIGIVGVVLAILVIGGIYYKKSKN